MSEALSNIKQAAQVLAAYERAIIALTIKAGGTLIIDTRAKTRMPRSQFTMTMVNGIATFQIQREN